MNKRLVVTLACAAAWMPQMASAAVTARQVGVYGDVRGGFPTETTRPSNSTVVTGLPTGPVSATSISTMAQGFSSYTALSFGTVSLVDAAEGSLIFNASTQALSAPGVTAMNPGAFARAIAATQYLFTLTAPSVFTSQYNVISSGTPAGYFRLANRDSNGNITTNRQQAGLQGTGGFTYNLAAGNYSLDWSNNVNTAFSRSSATTPFDQDAVSGILTFNITALPEPTSWGMMILGFGAVGVGMRRRRSPATATAALA